MGMKDKRMTVLLVPLILFAAMASVFALLYIEGKCRVANIEKGAREIFSSYAESDLDRLITALEGIDAGVATSVDAQIAAALLERSLSEYPLETELKRRTYSELSALERYLSGETTVAYDHSWLADVARDGISSLGENLPEMAEAETGDSTAFSPIFMPSGKNAALKCAQKAIGLSLKLRCGKSAKDGGSCVFYCDNAYAVINMYEMRCVDFSYIPTRFGNAELTADEADSVARDFMKNRLGLSYAESSRVRLGKCESIFATAYLEYDIAGKETARANKIIITV